MSTLTVTADLDSPQLAMMFGDYLTAQRGATVTTNSISGANFSKDFLLNQNLDQSWQSGSLAARKLAASGNVNIYFSLGASRTLSGLVIGAHNIRHPIKVYAYPGPSAFTPPSVVVGPLDPIVAADFFDFEFDNFDWTLGPSPELLRRLTLAKDLITPVDFGASYSGITHGRIEIIDQTGEPGDQMLHDYYQAGIVFAGEWYQPPGGVRWNWVENVEDLSLVVQTTGGTKTGQKLGTLRGVRFEQGHLSEYTAFRRVLTDFARGVGVLGRAFVWPRPSAKILFYDQSFIGCARELPSAAEYLIDTYQAPWAIVETK